MKIRFKEWWRRTVSFGAILRERSIEDAQNADNSYFSSIAANIHVCIFKRGVHRQSAFTEKPP
jgi:hypothetical protein